MNRRRAVFVLLTVLALFLVGTVVVLSSFTYFLAISPSAYITEREVPFVDNSTRWNGAEHGKQERVQRIIHQTWKTETLPQRWRGISQACRDMMPDYEYMLWTDAGSREFIAEHFPWFLETFDGYRYPIQRADAIRYFVLYHYGGIYVDLDIGCLRPMDLLLTYPVILPKTIPVGVSNDLMFAEKGHPFMKQTIEALINFDHSWVLNYPTVMFSTGPMFVSAQYAFYVSAHPDTVNTEIRILPKSLYGKNAKEDEAPHSFFSHFYGSSWHADDATFIAFLSTWGKCLMWLGLFILILGLIRLPSKPRRSLRRFGGYEIIFPGLSRSGRWHFFHLNHRSTPSSPSSSYSTPRSPLSEASSPTEEVPILQLPLHEDREDDDRRYAGRVNSPLVEAFRRVRNRVSMLAGSGEMLPPEPDTPARPRRQGRGVLFFLPAVFTPQSPDIELQPAPPPRSTRTVSASSLPRRAHPASMFPPEKQSRIHEDHETGRLYSMTSRNSSRGDLNSDDASHSRTSSSGTAVADEPPKDTWLS